MQVCALLLIMISAIAGLPSLREDRHTGTLNKQVVAGNPEQITEQRIPQENAQWVYLAVAGLAGVTVLMGAHKGKPGLIVGIATIGAGTCLVICGMTVHSQVHRPGSSQGTGKVNIPLATQRQAAKARATAQIKDQLQP